MGDVFLFRSAYKAVRHHFCTIRRLMIDGPSNQGLGVGQDLDKCILIIYIYACDMFTLFLIRIIS